MGRKLNFAEKPKRGPGKKTKKQPAPKFSKKILGSEQKAEIDLKKLSHRQKQRLVKRSAKKEKLQNANAKKKIKQQQKQPQKYQSDESEEENDSEVDSQESEEDVQEVEKSMKKGFTAEKNKKLPKTPVEESDDDDDDFNDGSDDDDSDVMRDDFGDEDSEDEQEEVSNKRKRDILDSEEDDSNEEEQSSNEESENGSDDESDDEKLPIEKASKKLKIQKEQDDKLADEELQLNIANKERMDADEILNVDKALNLQDVQQRIKDLTAILMDFSANRDPTRSRAEYLEVLKKDLCTYYSYNDFFMETLMDVFPVNELVEFLEASEVQRPLTIRTNSLIARRRDLAQALINRGVNLDPIGKWSRVGLTIYSSQVPLGATPEYLAGHYIIQGASSMLPVMALAPHENERILDMCAAPGGKSTHISAVMKNTGVLFSNDINKDRIHAIVGNFHRLGIANAVVTCVNGIEYKKFMAGFDRVLLDAPCSGSGVISKDPSVKTSKTKVDIQRCYNLQRKLILSAIDCLSAKSKTGGYLVYSTCSILPEENEWVVDYALKKRNVRLVPTGLDFGTEGFTSYREKRYHPSMKLTRRYYPHTHNMNGFFVAKLQKFSDAIPENVNENIEEDVNEDADEEEQPVKKKKVDKRDWFYKDLEETKKKPEENNKKQNYVTNVFEKPVKKEKSNKKKNLQNGKSKDTKPAESTPQKVEKATNGKGPGTSNSSGKKKKKFPKK